MSTNETDQQQQSIESKWTAEQDEEGKTYYYNAETGESRWEMPDELNDESQHQSEEKDGNSSNAAQSKPEWTQEKDEDGSVYYYDSVNNVTQWEKPDDFDAPKEGTVSEAKDQRGEDKSKTPGAKWETQQDEEGNTYYYNAATGETQWEKPEEIDAGDEEPQVKTEEPKVNAEERPPNVDPKQGPKWEAQTDEEGNTYYYNAATGETQWEKPDIELKAGDEGPKVKENEDKESTLQEDSKQEEAKHKEETKWVALTDEEGRTYYYNQDTEATQWDEPAEGFVSEGEAQLKSQQERPSDAGAEEEKRGESTDPKKEPAGTKWVAHKDEEGRTYFYNELSGETQWDEPAEGFVSAEDAAADSAAAVDGDQGTDGGTWIAHKDEEGREYYYNEESGETQWEKPEGAKIVAPEQMELEQSRESEDDRAPDSTESDDPNRTPSQDPIAMEVEQPEPEEVEEVDPAVKRLREAEDSLATPDSILEPDCFSNVTEVVASEDGNPTKALNLLVENYHSQTGVSGLLARWLSNMKSASASANRSKEESSEVTNNEIRNTAQEVISRVAKERFSKETGDGILDLSKSQAAFLQEMMDSSRWRTLLIDLSATHKESALLMYCLRTISKKGHHREIARRINQSDHFAVFKQMLNSELTVIGKLSQSMGHDVTTSIGMEELVDDLRRACTSTSYTYLYSLEVLRALEQRAHSATIESEESRRAFRKWEFLREDLENTMADPTIAATFSGSSPLFRKRRMDIALTISELHQRQRRRFTPPTDREEPRNGQGSLESAILSLLRRHAVGIQIDDSSLDPLLPSGLDAGDGGASVGELLVKHPLAIRAMLGCLYKPGSSRVTSPVLKNKCARLVALAVVAAEQNCMSLGEKTDKSNEVAVTRMILQGCQLCEQLEIMVSFLVSDGGKATGPPSAGLRLCNLATSNAAVAQGATIWAKELTQGSEFPTSASFPTLSVSILSLVRRIAIDQPFTRRDALSIALGFTKHSNPDVSYQKINAIKEQSIRLMLCILSKGETSAVLSGVSLRLQQQPELDASLVRYFVSGLLEIVKAPVSPAFARVLAQFLRVPKCVDAVRSSYFGEPHQSRLNNLLRSFDKLPVDEQQELSRKTDKSWIEAVLTTYRLE